MGNISNQTFPAELAMGATAQKPSSQAVYSHRRGRNYSTETPAIMQPTALAADANGQGREAVGPRVSVSRKVALTCALLPGLGGGIQIDIASTHRVAGRGILEEPGKRAFMLLILRSWPSSMFLFAANERVATVPAHRRGPALCAAITFLRLS